MLLALIILSELISTDLNNPAETTPTGYSRDQLAAVNHDNSRKTDVTGIFLNIFNI